MGRPHFLLLPDVRYIRKKPEGSAACPRVLTWLCLVALTAECSQRPPAGPSASQAWRTEAVLSWGLECHFLVCDTVVGGIHSDCRSLSGELGVPQPVASLEGWGGAGSGLWPVPGTNRQCHGPGRPPVSVSQTHSVKGTTESLLAPHSGLSIGCLVNGLTVLVLGCVQGVICPALWAEVLA